MMSRQILGLDRFVENGIRADFPIGLRGSVHLNEKDGAQNTKYCPNDTSRGSVSLNTPNAPLGRRASKHGDIGNAHAGRSSAAPLMAIWAFGVAVSRLSCLA